MTRIIFLLIIFLNLSNQALGQLISNEYYDVIDSCVTKSRLIIPIGEERFLGLPKKGNGLVYLLDKNQNKIELPCDQIEWINPIKTSGFKCLNDGKSAVVSISTQQVISPFYDSLVVLNPNFYLTWQNDSLFIFNTQNKLLYKTIAETTVQIRSCTSEQLLCMVKGEEFYLNTQGEASLYVICDNALSHINQDGSYKFKESKKWGLKNQDGSTLIEAKYTYINSWQNGQFVVSLPNKNKRNGTLYGVVDQNNKVLLPIEYERINTYEFGLSVRKEGCKNVFLENNFKNKYDKEFDELRVSKCGLIKGKLGTEEFYDLLFTKHIEGTTGKIVSAKGLSTELCQVLYEDGSFLIYDKSGDTIFSAKEKIYSATKVNEQVFEIKFDSKKSGLINQSGEWIVEPGNFTFQSTKRKDGIYKYEQTTRQSDLINSKGELIYSNVKNGGVISTTGNYIVSNKMGRAVVSPQGKLLIPFGKYRIHEFDTKYYRLIKNNKMYVVRLK